MKPILFNTEMVRAILDGRKTVTRRVVKGTMSEWDLLELVTNPSVVAVKSNGEEYPKELKGLYADFYVDGYPEYPVIRAPYQPGDILYVRETWRPLEAWNGSCTGCRIEYKAGGTKEFDKIIAVPETKTLWRPSIHMPKEAARIFLRVTDVRVERLHWITPVDVVNEGLYEDCRVCLDTYSSSGRQCRYRAEDECHICDSVITTFVDFWNSTVKPADINRYGWNANPWVWVIEFERIEEAGKNNDT